MQVDGIAIYALLDPVSCQVRYIGQAGDPHQRFRKHLDEAIAPRRRTHKKNWLRDLLVAGHRPVMRILEVVPASAADAHEMAWIKAFGRQDLGEGELTNASAGGLTPRGRTASPEARARVSAGLKGKKHSAERRRRQREATHWRAGLMEYVRTNGQSKTPEHRQRLGESLKGHGVSPETREKIRQSLQQHYRDSPSLPGGRRRDQVSFSPEQRDKIRRTLQQFYKDNPTILPGGRTRR